MKDTDKLLNSLLAAESEEQVSAIVNKDKQMSNTKAWTPLDNRDTNMNVVTNQSSSGAKAATELITNMVDSMLIKGCREKGIDPKDKKKTPPNMYMAVREFIKEDLQTGKIITAETSWLTEYARENLVIGVTAPKGKRNTNTPCLTFIDNGEGQEPQAFPKTFLSLSAKYKSSIDFVQGKYNMGSSGVLNYCGNNWYKLIVSRKYDKKSAWGWTLIRKSPGSEDDVPFAEYFYPDKNIPTLSNKEDIIYPLHTQNGKQYKDVYSQSGCIVKLYSYYLGAQQKGFETIRAAFSENMVETVLPIKLSDFTASPGEGKGPERSLGIDSRPFNGMHFLLCRHKGKNSPEEDNDNENWEATSINKISHPKFGEINISAYLFSREDIPGWYKLSNSRIFHHVNGQTMYKETRGALTQCNFPALKDRVVIFVDSSKLKNTTSIWKGDRENIQSTQLGDDYKEAIRDSIKNSDTLKKWNNTARQEELDSAAPEIDADIAEDIINNDPNMQDLLDDTVPNIPIGPGQNPVIGSGAEGEKPFEGKHSPTFVTCMEKSLEETKEININRAKPFMFNTDVENNYFIRNKEPGNYKFFKDGEPIKEIENKFQVNIKLKDGELEISLKPVPENVSIGDTFRFTIGLQDSSMPVPIIAKEHIKAKIVVQVPSEKSTNGDGSKRRKKKKTTPRKLLAGLPPYELLTNDGREINLRTDVDDDSDLEKTTSWKTVDFDCNKHDGGMIEDLGENKYKHYINYDNVRFQNYLDKLKDHAKTGMAKHKYILGMRIMLLGIENGLKLKQLNNNGEGFNVDYHEEFRRRAIAGAASVLLTLCETLPDKFAVDDDE